MSDDKKINLLASDLGSLYFVANAVIPNIAEDFGKANRCVNNSLEKADPCMFMDEGGEVRAIAKLFEDMTDHLQDNFAANYENLYEVSDVLYMTLDDLKNADELSGREIEDLKEEFDSRVAGRKDKPYNEPPSEKHKPASSDDREDPFTF